MIYDKAIIGAGASGLMAATFLRDEKICVIDSQADIGAKIKISGGGKCNITNQYLDSSHYLGEKDFIQNTLDTFDNEMFLHFLNKNGVDPFIDEKIVKGTYFCQSSKKVIEMFRSLTKNVHFYLENKVIDVEKSGDTFTVVCENKKLQAKSVIVASGGLSYPRIGASDIGYKIATKFGHTITKLDPALVGFTVQKEQFWFKELSGLSVDVRIMVEDKKIEGKMLFTHKGCSGPAILTASLYWKKGLLGVDFLPFAHSYLPKRLKKIIKENNIDPKNYSFAPAGNFGYSKAEVTRGGVKTQELSCNFESIYQKGLYFIGEVVDVTGELGGYNLQWAWSSAFCIKN